MKISIKVSVESYEITCMLPNDNIYRNLIALIFHQLFEIIPNLRIPQIITDLIFSILVIQKCSYLFGNRKSKERKHEVQHSIRHLVVKCMSHVQMKCPIKLNKRLSKLL